MSVGELLAEAPKLQSISGDIPTQAFALTRLLLAVVRRAIDWGRDPLATWFAIWTDQQLPMAVIDQYLASVRNRFDLLHPAEPFYQVADLHTAKGEFKPIELLLADVPAGWKYFSTRAGRGTESLNFGEAARWLVHCQAFDASGIKSADPRDPRGKGGKGYPIGVAWAGQLGGVVFEGRNIFDTLMLNTVVVDRDGKPPDDSDLPAWEREHASYRERDSLIPTGPADLLTWQSRRVRLVADGERVTQVVVANGDPIESHNRHRIEHMTGWRYSEPQSKRFGEDRYLPQQWSPDRALWRGVEGLLADTQDGDRMRTLASGTVHWLEMLADQDVLEAAYSVQAHTYGLNYINNASVLGASIDDSLQMQIMLLGRNSIARIRAGRAVDSAAEAVRALKTLARRLAQAAGGTGEGDAQQAEAAAYFALDDHYRRWLAGLTNDDDPTAVTEWEKTVRDEITPAGMRLVTDAGEHAWRGRVVDGKHLDSALALTWFRAAVRKALPLAFDGDSTDESDAQ